MAWGWETGQGRVTVVKKARDWRGGTAEVTLTRTQWKLVFGVRGWEP